jgi:hypothetical protein
VSLARRLAATLLVLPAGAVAAPIGVLIEPAAVGIERLDALYATSGLESRTAGRLGAGCAVTFGPRWSIGLEAGVAAGSTDFGLLEDPQVRLVRTDVHAELRGRVPGVLHGFALQLAAGGGRLGLRYHPDHVELAAGGTSYAVDLEPVGAWTRHVAAEVLHPVPGGEIGLRAVWRFYALDVASPAGVTKQDARDLLLGVVLRVAAR